MTTKAKNAGVASKRLDRKASMALAMLADLTEDQFPDSKQHIKSIIHHAIEHTGPPEAGLKNAKNNLTMIHKAFGSQVLAQTAKFFYEFLDSDAYYDKAVYSVAACFKEGKADILEKTVSFMVRNNCEWSTWDVPSLIKAIDTRGVTELELGMNLAQPAGPDPEPPVLPQHWRPEIETSRRRKMFAMLTGKLGLTRLTDLTSKLKAEGFSHNDITTMTEGCAHAQDQEREIRRVFEAVALVKGVGLDHSRSKNPPPFRQESLATVVYETSKSREATRTEIKEVLRLMSNNGVEWISRQDFGIALRYNRRPSQRGIVLKAFKAKAPHLLSWARVSEGLTIALDGYVASGIEATDKALDKLDSQDANGRTQEIMSARYIKFGIFGPDKEFVQELSKNPIFVPELLALRKSETKTQLGMVDRAAHVFGKDTMNSVTRFAESGMEPEYALALLRTRNPTGIVKALNTVPSDSRLSAIRIINHQGLQVLRQSVEILRASGLDSRTFLQPIAAGLANKDGEIIPVRPQIFKEPLKKEHEQQLHFFHSQPPLWQRNVARAVRMYRSIYTITYLRIRHDLH
jgi:hypothetical protein